jgi:hypothetical protein
MYLDILESPKIGLCQLVGTLQCNKYYFLPGMIRSSINETVELC